jgi:hypothetical protein
MEPYLQSGREALGSGRAEAAERAGQEMSYLEAVEYALAWLTT